MMLYAHETITVYNRYLEGSVEKWVGTVITPASWAMQTAAALTPEGMRFGTQAVIRIPEGADAQGKSYLPPGQWGPEKSAQSWTLRGGDRIARGEHETAPQGAAGMRSLPDLVTVMEWADNRRGFGLRHWKAVGK